jgi:hypothetical protein
MKLQTLTGTATEFDGIDLSRTPEIPRTSGGNWNARKKDWISRLRTKSRRSVRESLSRRSDRERSRNSGHCCQRPSRRVHLRAECFPGPELSFAAWEESVGFRREPVLRQSAAPLPGSSARRPPPVRETFPAKERMLLERLPCLRIRRFRIANRRRRVMQVVTANRTPQQRSVRPFGFGRNSCG